MTSLMWKLNNGICSGEFIYDCYWQTGLLFIRSEEIFFNTSLIQRALLLILTLKSIRPRLWVYISSSPHCRCHEEEMFSRRFHSILRKILFQSCCFPAIPVLPGGWHDLHTGRADSSLLSGRKKQHNKSFVWFLQKTFGSAGSGTKLHKDHQRGA